MSNAVLARSKPEAKWALLDKQVAQATSLLRQMRDTIEDIEDARTIERVKKVHGHKPRIPWSRVRKMWCWRRTCRNTASNAVTS
jgi:hypothetical protein